ncbi:MAG TPA: hypothetical protein PL163_09340 [Leptospiraceae bacterium]|nr:hypothetical protein [Leptospiraceae bacterium]HMY66844.1 hypothetical protein [Leptospiraceae bacterium]HNF27787.1 hypothetical protein [Leptospiraceae bacterium]HNM03399.1 hypothetical protein [Leptospiraceae bacterium]HNO22380.1 hypothetical protein [Leptospiraceae bacterium]
MKFLFLLFLFPVYQVFSVPTTLRIEEKENYQFIESVRAKKFADREIDRLHQSIIKMLARMKEHETSGSLKNSAKYTANVPEEPEIVFKKDAEGKEYFSLFLSQAVSPEDYPVYHIINTRVYVYPSEDLKTLKKVILQFNRVNANLENPNFPVYVKEMRRIINNTPNFPEKQKTEGDLSAGIPKFQQENITDASLETQQNGDLVMEYYTDIDGKLAWVDEKPVTGSKPSLSGKILDEKLPVPYDIQNKIYLTYRDTLREIDSKIKRKLKIMDTNQRIIIRKMMEVN